MEISSKLEDWRFAQPHNMAKYIGNEYPQIIEPGNKTSET